MSNVSTIIRRVLRKGIKSTQGIEGAIAKLIGDDWPMMLNSSRSQREGLIQRLAEKIEGRINENQFGLSTAAAKSPSTVQNFA